MAARVFTLFALVGGLLSPPCLPYLLFFLTWKKWVFCDGALLNLVPLAGRGGGLRKCILNLNASGKSAFILTLNLLAVNFEAVWTERLRRKTAFPFFSLFFSCDKTFVSGREDKQWFRKSLTNPSVVDFRALSIGCRTAAARRSAPLYPPSATASCHCFFCWAWPWPAGLTRFEDRVSSASNRSATPDIFSLWQFVCPSSKSCAD